MTENTAKYWFVLIKKELLENERRLLGIRNQHCDIIVNRAISKINKELGITFHTHINIFKCGVKMENYIHFLKSWKGLKTIPNNKDSYFKKSKNWLNGRRAPVYGNNLFPAMVESIEKYVLQCSKNIYVINEKKRELFKDICMAKILGDLCECKLFLSFKCKKSSFFCLNAVKKKSKLRTVLQSYAKEIEYPQGFPSCFQVAIDFFQKKYIHLVGIYRGNIISNFPNNVNNNINVNNNDKIICVIDQDSETNEDEIEYWKRKTQQLNTQLQMEIQNTKQAEEELNLLKKKN